MTEYLPRGACGTACASVWSKAVSCKSPCAVAMASPHPGSRASLGHRSKAFSCKEPIRFVDSSKTQARKNGLVFPLFAPNAGNLPQSPPKASKTQCKLQYKRYFLPEQPPRTITLCPDRPIPLYHARLTDTASRPGVSRRQRPAILTINTLLAGTQLRGQRHQPACHGVLGLVFVWSSSSQ